DFREGLAATIEWYRTHEHWWRPQKDATEQAYREAGESVLGK
ncbi:dTDP-glucose 4,6-dehydratase, partial [Rhodococcus ruber]|nr:dTDP-glucose 4,6-dehydratase [Rhodococcus ruber]